MTPVLALYLLGPGARELERLADNLAAYACHAPDLERLILILDGPTPDDLAACLLANPCPFPVETWISAGMEAKLGFPGRVTYALGHAYHQISQRYPNRHVLRVDSDALPIGSFVARLAALAAAHPDAGVFGSVNLSSDGKTSPGNPWRHVLLALARPLARVRGRPRLQSIWLALSGHRARLRRVVAAYIATGIMPGNHAQGGVCLITGEAIQRLSTFTDLRNPKFAADYWITDDVLASVLIVAKGLRLHALNQPGDPLGSCWRGYPGYNPAGALARGHGIIHSIKDCNTTTEAETRAYFRALRSAVAAV